MSGGNEVVEIALEWVRKHGREGDVSPGEVDAGTNLLLSGVLDSLGFVEMLAHLEESAGLVLDLAELDPEEFTTIAGIARNASSVGRKAS